MFNLLVIDQGISVENITTETTCMVAYADSNHDRLFTAGHCGAPGDSFSFDGHQIGVFSTEFTGLPGVGDWGLIQLNEHTVAGKNTVTGNSVTNEADLTPGTEICRLAVDQSVVCGLIGREAVQGLLLASPSLQGFPGDSGGPVWNADGFVGIYTGHWMNGTVALVRIPGEYLPVDAAPPATSSALLSS